MAYLITDDRISPNPPRSSLRNDGACSHQPGLAAPAAPTQAARSRSRCPVSPTHPLDHGHISGVGAGPIYALPSPFSANDRHPGSLASKTIWAWPTNLRTHAVRVLVRGMRLDRPGLIRFQLGQQWDTAPLTAELRIDTSQTVGSFGESRWGTTVTMLLAQTPGCYGFQLDFEPGTSTIVVGATHP